MDLFTLYDCKQGAYNLRVPSLKSSLPRSFTPPEALLRGLELCGMSISLHSYSSERREMLTSSIASRNLLLSELFKVPSLALYLLPEMKIVPLAVNQVIYEQGDQL